MNSLDEFLLRAYLNGDLDADAAAAFELLMLERPDLAELVEADTALRIGLKSVGVSAVASPVTDTMPLAPSRTKPRRYFVWAAAASVLVAVGVGTVLVRTPKPLAAMEATTLAYVDKTRAISAKVQLPIPATRTLILLVPVAAEACKPEVTLTQGNMEPFRAEATPDEFGYASLVVPTDVLRIGDAVIDVRCGNEPAAQYDITFIEAPPKGH